MLVGGATECCGCSSASTGSLRWAGSVTMLAAGGFVPVVRGWLRNEIDGWSDVVATLGGVWFAVETRTRTAISGRSWPGWMHRSFSRRSTRLGGGWASSHRGRSVSTYLPCCGVVAWGRSRALDHRAAALPGAYPGRAAGHRRARAGPPRAGGCHASGPIGPVRRGARAGRRAKRPACSRSARRLGTVLPAMRHPG